VILSSPMPKIIQDKFTRMRISDQRRYQLRREAKGLCRLCGSPAVKSKREGSTKGYCEAHYARQLAYGQKPLAVTPALEDLI